jgi:voltage-gated potassium channel
MQGMSLREAVREHGVRVVLRYLYEATTPVAKNFPLRAARPRRAEHRLDRHRLLLRADPGGAGGGCPAGRAAAGREFAMRVAASGRPWHAATRPLNIADLLAILSLLLAPLLHGALGFLRVLRTLRLLHSVRLISSLRSDLPFFRRNEEATLAAAQLGVFLFIMSGLVFESQHRTNPGIANYADALYFTVTTLTTTGFGDITLPGTTGRLLSVVIMLAGVTLFLRLATALFRPVKVRYTCPSCSLQRHESDAVHCKACGVVLQIPDEGNG